MLNAVYTQTPSLQPPTHPRGRRTAAVSANRTQWRLRASQSDRRRDQRNPFPGDLDHRRTGIPEESGGAPLKGSDVLWALQRAAVQKGKKPRPARRGGGGKKKLPPGGDLDYGEVRPINVREEWEGRMNELERRLQQLITQYH